MATNGVRRDKNEEEKKPLADVINDFLTRNRKKLLIGLVALMAILVAVFVYFIVVDYKNTSATAKIESINEQWAKAKVELDGQDFKDAEDTFLADITAIAKHNKGLSSGARAYMTAAEIYFNRKDWSNARDLYFSCVKADSDIYSAPVAYYNAAVCSEELGEYDEAIANYEKAYNHTSFTQKPRALFNIGRIEEQRGNTDLAISSYEKLSAEYPENSWTHLAKSRIISLQIQ